MSSSSLTTANNKTVLRSTLVPVIRANTKFSRAAESKCQNVHHVALLSSSVNRLRHFSRHACRMEHAFRLEHGVPATLVLIE